MRQVRKEEQDGVNETGEQNYRHQATAKERPEEGMGQEVENSLGIALLLWCQETRDCKSIRVCDLLVSDATKLHC